MTKKVGPVGLTGLTTIAVIGALLLVGAIARFASDCSDRGGVAVMGFIGPVCVEPRSQR